ncbi:MAG: hypothetical protein ACK59A_00480 [Cyanobacteriota bacterium]
MSFDARSKERLEALGRTLPKKLPPPEPPSTRRANDLPSPSRQAPADSPRHRLEREQDPAALFRALMQASPDGSVPPHLLERLRELEAPRPPMAASAPPIDTPSPRPSTKGPKGSPSPGNRRAGRVQRAGGEDQDLYTAFAQLLLEDDGEV